MRVLRTRTSSTGFWPIFARRKRKPLAGPFWYRQPGRHLPRCLFSPGRSLISRDATENPMARTAAGSCSGMDEYELHGHLSEQLLRLIGGYFENFYSSVSRISEEIYFQQAVYFSYTSSIKVSGLTNGQAYVCAVSATNDVGSSPISEASAPVPPVAPPPGC